MVQAIIERVKTLEKGYIFFFYRPKETRDRVGGREAVERFYAIMKPDGREEYRRALIGRRQPPDQTERGIRFRAVTDRVTKDPEQLLQDLRKKDYETGTPRERFRPAARAAGEGRYLIFRHGDWYYGEMHTHFIYQLEPSGREREAQKALGIEPQASYIITVRNPQMPSPEQAVPEPKEEYQFPGAEEEKIFRGRRFASADPVELLDHAGVGFELVSAADDLQAEFGLELNAEREDIRSAELFRELRLEQSKPPVAPLFREKGK